MLLQLDRLEDLDGAALMGLYRESNEENCGWFFPGESLETDPDFRRKGYAASLAAHRNCGFTVDRGRGVNLLTGEADEWEYGLLYAWEPEGTR